MFNLVVNIFKVLLFLTLMNHPVLSVIIPAYNEEKDIGNCLSSLQKQSYPKNKIGIIIVDDGSTDKTCQIVKKFKSVKLIKGKHKGPGFSRNLGAKKAKGEILIFVDADMTFDKDYLKNLTEPIIKKKVIGTEEGMQIASNRDNIWSRCWGTHFKDYPNIKKGHIFRAIPKKKFKEMGGFDPIYGYADDLTFYFKYGVRSKWVRNAICYHKNPETLNEVYKQSSWIGASIQNPLFNLPILSHLIPIILILLSPLAIPLLAIRHSYKNKEFGLLIPWMLIFMTFRYFGTIKGLFHRTYLRKNVR